MVLAKELTEEAIYDAIRHFRVYATEDADLKIEYRLNDRIMGSVIGETETLTATILLADGSGDPIGLLEIITEEGDVAAAVSATEASGEYTLNFANCGSYYYLRIRRDGETIAVTAPVWLENYEDLGIADFSSDVSTPMQGEAVTLSLTLFNHEDLPFLLENVTFSAGSQVIKSLDNPGSVAPVEKLTIPLTYTQDTAGSVTITATVTGSIGGLKRSYQKTLTLYYQAPKAKPQSVKTVRSGLLGEPYRIRGYVTAGTSKPHNSFPGSIYLQDDSGGIQITDFYQKGIQVGAPMEIQGILRSQQGNLVLSFTDGDVLEEDFYRYVPETMLHGEAMDYETHGGQLLQIEGHVISVTKTADGKGVSRFTLRDYAGDLATVIVEDGIGSGAYGTNELASEVIPSRSVRAMGLLHIDEFGKTVLRVRNCDEVVYVPPVKDPTNPKSGDWLAWLLSRF